MSEYAPRQHRGKRAYLTGTAAEERVLQSYMRTGCIPLHRRWRGGGAEIDLILRDGDIVVFTEVKAARSHEEAFSRLNEAQMKRIHAAAACYLSQEPAGQLTDVRFDLALYDRTGTVRIHKNAFGHF